VPTPEFFAILGRQPQLLDAMPLLQKFLDRLADLSACVDPLM
jgi:hypothetical protein